MYLIEIIKLIVLVLPCILAQINEFTFIRSPPELIYNNVTNTQETKLICISPGPMHSFAIVDHLTKEAMIIVNRSELVDKYSERFNYTVNDTNPDEVINTLIIKYANLYETELYFCSPNDDLIYSMRLQSFYPPARPICTSIKSNEGTTLLCESELGKPAMDKMTISNSTGTYTPTSVGTNGTHTSQRVRVYGYGENITCTTIYNFIQKDMVYTTTQSCMFDDVLPSTTSIITGSTDRPATSIITGFTDSLPTTGIITESMITSGSHSMNTLVIDALAIFKYGISALIMTVLRRLI